jgi:hypothetical protein
VVGSLLQLLHDPDEAVTHVAVAFDRPIESFRNRRFAGYKDGADVDPALLAQFEDVEVAVGALGVTVWSMDEHEADDALATAALRFVDEVEQVRVLTPDKDLAQVVRGRADRAGRPLRETVRDEAGVVARFGVGPASIPDLLALVGDTADGIPGLPGFGAKTAASAAGPLRPPRRHPAGRSRLGRAGPGRGATGRDPARAAEDALLYRELATLVHRRAARGDARRSRLGRRAPRPLPRLVRRGRRERPARPALAVGRVSAGDASGDMRRHSSLVAAGILLSRLSGLVRDAVIAFFLGANLGADAFRAALKIPNLLQNLLGEGVLSASFIPTYSRLLEQGREEEAGRVAGAVLGCSPSWRGIGALLGVVFAYPLTRLLTPGFVGERLELTVTLVRIMFPGIALLVVSAWCLGVLNSHRRFFLSYLAPVMWNLGILIVLIGLGATSILDPASRPPGGSCSAARCRSRSRCRPCGGCCVARCACRSTPAPPGVRQVLRSFWPIVFGRGVVQVAALLELVVASLLATGAVAVLAYAQTLYLMPIALFGMSIAAAELPTLSRLDHDGHAELEARLDAGLARSAFFVVGASVALLFLGGPLVDLLYGRGSSTPQRSSRSAGCWRCSASRWSPPPRAACCSRSSTRSTTLVRRPGSR